MDMEKESGAVIECHTAGPNMNNCTSSPVITSHGLFKGLYYVTPASIIRLFSCNQIVHTEAYKATQMTCVNTFSLAKILEMYYNKSKINSLDTLSTGSNEKHPAP